MKKIQILWLFVCCHTVAFAQEELLANIEIRAYIDQQSLPQYTPNDCPALEELIEDDQLATRVVSTLMYELINFWGNESSEGAESVDNSEDVVYWKVIKTDNDNYEAVLKTENIRLGKRIYQHLEVQQEQNCFNWALVFSNEEIAAVEESDEAELVVERDFEKPDAYDVYDPYVGAYISEFGNPDAPNDLAIAEEQRLPSTTFEFGGRDMNVETAPDSYSNTNNYNNRLAVSNRAPAFSSMMPAASTELNLPSDFFSGLETVGDVERRIASVLETRGYANKGYFEFDNGFMIATQMEGIASSGAPKAAQYRFPSRIVFNQSLTFQNYMNSLFLPERSKYRMFVFYVEAAPDRAYRDFNEIDYSVADSRNFGNNRRSPLPDNIANLPYRHKSNFDANVKVLVYEAQTGANNRRPSVLSNPTLSAREHLVRSGLWNWFEER